MNFELGHSSLVDSQLLSTTLNLGWGFSTPTHTFFTHIHHTFPGLWPSFLSPPIFLLFNLTVPFAPLVIAAQSDFSSSSLIATIFPHPPPAQLVLAFASAAKSLPGFTSQTQFENENTFIAHALAPNKLFTQIHSMSSNPLNSHPSISNSVHSLKSAHSTSASLTMAWSTQGYLTLCCHLVLDSQFELVFKSLVKSGFLTPKGATMDCNQSKPLPLLGGPQPNRIGPVLFGSVAPQRLVGTGPNSYFYRK